MIPGTAVAVIAVPLPVPPIGVAPGHATAPSLEIAQSGGSGSRHPCDALGAAPGSVGDGARHAHDGVSVCGSTLVGVPGAGVSRHGGGHAGVVLLSALSGIGAGTSHGGGQSGATCGSSPPFGV